MPLLGRRLPSIDQHQHASSDARVAAPPDTFGHLSATLHRLDGLVSVAAPVGEVFGVVPGEVLGPSCKQDLVENLFGVVRLLVLVAEVVDANLVVGRPHIRQLEFVQLLALVDGCDFHLVRVQFLVWNGGREGEREEMGWLVSCCSGQFI